jgi:hypothetical protein
MKVMLAPTEQFVAATIGQQRYTASRMRGLTHKVFQDDTIDVARRDQHAAGSEIAVAKALGLYWPPSWNADKEAPDIPPDIQVRWTTHHAGKLILRDGDPAGRYVLVRGTTPEFELIGWASSEDAMQPDYLTNFGRTDAPPCFAVPNDCLNPISTLEVDQRVPQF